MVLALLYLIITLVLLAAAAGYLGWRLYGTRQALAQAEGKCREMEKDRAIRQNLQHLLDGRIAENRKLKSRLYRTEDALREMEQLDLWFPELKALIGIPQPPQHHPEGDAWNHTMRVLDASSAMRAQAEEPLYLLLAALCHDLGKAVSTVTEADGRIRAIGHEETGIPLAERLLSRISHEKKLRLYVRNMITLHMLPNIMVSQKAGRKPFNRLFDRSVCPEDLLLLCKADLLGSALDEVSYRPYEEVLRGHLADYRALTAEPGVTGDDLIAAGFRPGTAFREALDYARRLQLAGVCRKDALPQTLAFLWQREAEEAAPVPAAGGKNTSNC